MLPLHRLSLTLWFIMVHSGLVSCHNSMEKSISFTSMTVQMLLTNRLPCTLVVIGQLPWHPSATHFPISEVIMDNTVRRVMTHVNSAAISSTVTRLESRIRCSTCCFTVSLATLTGLPLRCSSLTFCRPFKNLSTHSYTLP